MVFAERILPEAPAPRRRGGRVGARPGAAEARARLEEVARRARPVVPAAERRIPVPGPLGALLPHGGLQRGTVVSVDGQVGAGATSLVLELMAAVTAAGEWAATVDLDSTFGAVAAAEAGVALDRLAVIRGVEPARWAHVVATILDGVTVVAAGVPPFLRSAEARRLVARARERAAVLVTTGPWPGEAAVRLRAEGSTWDGLGRGDGHLAGRSLRVQVTGRGAAGRGRVGEVPFRVAS